MELDIQIVQHAVFEPVIGRQVHGFLGRACTFDRHGRLTEKRPSVLEILDEVPGVAGHALAVIGRDPIGAQRLL